MTELYDWHPEEPWIQTLVQAWDHIDAPYEAGVRFCPNMRVHPTGMPHCLEITMGGEIIRAWLSEAQVAELHMMARKRDG